MKKAAFLIVVSALVSLGPGLGGGVKPAPTVDELIRRLGSDDSVERDSASKELAGREDARPALEKALGSRDAEVVRRAQRILAGFRTRRLGLALEALPKLAEKRQIDSMVELLTMDLDRDLDVKHWNLIVDVVQTLLDLEEKTYGSVPRPIDLSDKKPRRIGMLKTEVEMARARGQVRAAPCMNDQALGSKEPFLFLLRCQELDLRQSRFSVTAICSGPQKVAAFGGILWGGGSVTDIGDTGGSVIVVDGDVKATGISQSLVIAKGSVTAFDAFKSTILCGGPIKIKQLIKESTLVSAKDIRPPPPENIQKSTLKEKEADALRFVKFFEVEDAGIEVKDAKGGVEVSATLAGKPLSGAGIKAGDLIVAVNKDGVKSADSLRRLLRKEIALGDSFTLRVRRAGKELEFRVQAEKTP
jgi:hypothetical protein